MKTPISYYGGKQKLAPVILSMIPTHNLYAEPFCGGAAVFFAKPPSSVEVINDTNSELINFYKVAQTKFEELQLKVQSTLHSRQAHFDANVIYQAPHLFSDVDRAWALWVLAAQSFSSNLDGHFGYDIAKATTSIKIQNKVSQFTEELKARLQHVCIENTDALRIIKSRDRVDSFFYIDPPYYNSNCGHYDGYTIEDFELLLKLLGEIGGKFLLSSYPSDILKDYQSKYGWKSKSSEHLVSVNKGAGRGKIKTEVLTFNY